MIPSISAGSRNSVPVEPGQYVYSQFKYVAGIPARGGQQGVSVDKLRILNNLIDQLVSLKQKNVEPKQWMPKELNGSQIDTLIDQYQKQIRTATATAETLLYKPAMPQTSGAIVNLVA
jgi:hypothetical protein